MIIWPVVIEAKNQDGYGKRLIGRSRERSGYISLECYAHTPYHMYTLIRKYVALEMSNDSVIILFGCQGELRQSRSKILF